MIGIATVDTDMILIACLAYGLVSLLFLAETYVEGEKQQAGWDVWRAGGLALGLVWPLYALAVLVAALWSTRSANRAPMRSK
jgi:hypothetical protein